jgi:hypothetical protein
MSKTSIKKDFNDLKVPVVATEFEIFLLDFNFYFFSFNLLTREAVQYLKQLSPKDFRRSSTYVRIMLVKSEPHSPSCLLSSDRPLTVNKFRFDELSAYSYNVLKNSFTYLIFYLFTYCFFVLFAAS